MQNWNIMLEWILQFDDEHRPTEIPPMPPAQLEFVNEAIKTFSRTSVLEAKRLLAEIAAALPNPAQHSAAIEALEKLTDSLCDPSAVRNLCQFGGLYRLFTWAVDPNIAEEIRVHCLSILSFCCQNNVLV